MKKLFALMLLVAALFVTGCADADTEPAADIDPPEVVTEPADEPPLDAAEPPANP